MIALYYVSEKYFFFFSSLKHDHYRHQEVLVVQRLVDHPFREPPRPVHPLVYAAKIIIRLFYYFSGADLPDYFPSRGGIGDRLGVGYVSFDVVVQAIILNAIPNKCESLTHESWRKAMQRVFRVSFQETF